VPASEALAIGLVNTVAPADGRDALEDATSAVVEGLLAAPAEALRALKPLLRSAEVSDREEQLAAEREAQTGLLLSLLSSGVSTA
jgi:enoyl-CoA hydratase/carnithine racemase